MPKQPWELPLEMLCPRPRIGVRWQSIKRKPYRLNLVEYEGQIMSAGKVGQLRRRKRERENGNR